MPSNLLSIVSSAIVIGGLLAGCASDFGLAPSKPKTAGIVVGDEPYAVNAAGAVMASGGDAADAATAMYFALSVTYPVAAGLGGGGICLVHDPASSRNEEFDFLARDPSGGGVFAIPGNVRGFAAMQAAYGVLPWQRVISSSESYASAGFLISQALATRLNASENIIRLDAGLASEFMDESGHVKSAGSLVANRELAETLSAVRTRGADAFYQGILGDQIVAYSTAQGGSITAAELAGYSSARRVPHILRFNDRQIFLPDKQTGAGAFAAALFDEIVHVRRSESMPAYADAAVTAIRTTLDGFGVGNLPTDLGATGFAATDINGQAVACAVTMNGPFGSGHTARDNGVALAGTNSNSRADLAAAFLVPILATDNSGALSLAGAGAGGPIGAASLFVALAGLAQGEPVTSSNGLHPEIVSYDTVNAIVCQTNSCAALTDAGANGLGVTPGR